jgi:hypothetical protein
MFRTALIIFALVLASCVSAHAQPGNASSESASPKGTAAGSPADDMANEFAAVVCTDVTNQEFQTIPVGPGQKPADLCRNAQLQVGYVSFKDPLKAPTIPGNWPPPAGWDDLEMQLNKEAQMQLDAIAAAKLKNETPAQQTPEQKASGQLPP